MGILALHAASSGMKAMDTKLDVTANNLANVNTVGFKRSRVNFEDLFYLTRREPGMPNVDDEPIPLGLQVGTGVEVSNTQMNMEEGSVDPTNKPMDWRIDGEGLFKVRTIFQGEQITAYTRAGDFTINREGTICLGNSQGPPLEPPVQIPQDAMEVAVTSDGEVRVLQPGETQLTAVGQVELARFVNPEGLKQIGGNLYIETDASGPPVEGNPQTDGLGGIAQSQLEMSNVDPVRELVSLITTQRSFELNSKSIQSANQFLQTIVNLVRI